MKKDQHPCLMNVSLVGGLFLMMMVVEEAIAMWLVVGSVAVAVVGVVVAVIAGVAVCLLMYGFVVD